MYERTKYISKRFIRNGIGGIALLSLYIFAEDLKSIRSEITIAVLVFYSAISLFSGLRMKSRLKNKSSNSEDDFQQNNSRFYTTEFALTTLLLLAVLTSLRAWEYPNYLSAVVVVIYFGWMIKEIIGINKYLNSPS